MCDTLCVIGAGHALFGKNSDRPRDEVQVLESYPRRDAGGTVRTTYLELADAGAHALVGSRPVWMWGLEHGVNEHAVAIGNERIFTTIDPHDAPPALIGMDLVRLGLERGATANEALTVMTDLLERHGQGGSGINGTDDPYWSSFLVTDPEGAWVLETSGSTWAARRVEDGAAISNRVTLGRDWDRASDDVAPGTDLASWLDPDVPTEQADVRLAVTRSCVATTAAALTPEDLVATLRSHGPDDAGLAPPPAADAPGWDGFSVCWHLRTLQSTTASIVARLSHDERPIRAWAALGSPCASVYVPILVPDGVPAVLADPSIWSRFAALRDRVEDDPGALTDVRAVLDPLEAELWGVAPDEIDADAAIPAALDRLGV